MQCKALTGMVRQPCGTCEFRADFFTGRISLLLLKASPDASGPKRPVLTYRLRRPGDLFFEAGSCVPTDCINLNLRNRAIASFDPNVLDAFVNVETIDLGVNKLDETDLAELRWDSAWPAPRLPCAGPN
eukprot:2524695-Rhodomonas_salina.1